MSSTISIRRGATFDLNFILPQEDGAEGGLLPSGTSAIFEVVNPRTTQSYLALTVDILTTLVGEANATLKVTATDTALWDAGLYRALVVITRPLDLVEIYPSPLEQRFVFVVQ